MADLPTRGRGRGRPRRRPAVAPVAPRRGPGRAVRAVRVDTPPVVGGYVEDSVAQSVVHPWLSGQGPAQTHPGAQIGAIPAAQQIPVVSQALGVPPAAPDSPAAAPDVPLTVGIAQS